MNEKTKNSSKIIFRIVAILLCLVLITTSIVSSTLAKFTVTKEATTEVSFKTFGVKLRIRNGKHADNAYLDNNSVSVTHSITDLYPGVSPSKDIMFIFTNTDSTIPATLNVKATLKIKVDVELDDVFFISSDDFSSLDETNFPAGKAYMPFRFVAGRVRSETQDAVEATSSYFKSWLSADSVELLEASMEREICTRLKAYISSSKATVNDVDGNRYVSYNYTSVGSQMYFPSPYYGFGLHVDWVKGNRTSASEDDRAKNMIGTWIAEKIAKKQAADANYVPVKFVITVSLEQTVN